MGRWMVYGATGYTGKLIVEHAVAKGLSPIVAGRSAERVGEVARRHGCEQRVFSVDDPASVREALADVDCCLSVAGPFAATAQDMMGACIEAGTHYLDVTGEIDVFELAAGLDSRAEAAGVMLLPGVGFDVVPSDCLAAHVAGRVREGRELRIAIAGLGSASRGTMKTALAAIGDGTRVRRDGQIVSLTDLQWADFDLGRGKKRCIGVSWGDVSTAYHSTGIPNVTVYFVAAGPMGPMMRLGRVAGGLLSKKPVQRLLARLIDRAPEGPSEQELETDRSVLLAEVVGADGKVHRSRLETPNGYALTYQSAVAVVERVLAGDAPAGFRTPSLAYGADFVLELPNTSRTDLD